MHTVHLPQHTTLLTLFRKPTIFVKALCLLLLVGFLGIEGAKGQTTLLTETFGTTATLPTGWSSSNTTNGWIGSTSSASNNSGASGGANVLFNNLSAGTGPYTLTYSNTFSTVGYTNITVLWGARATASFNGTISFQWSSDGTTYNTVSYTDVSNNATWASVNGGTRISLPAGAAGQANLRFRFNGTPPASTVAGNYRIDDFTVQGTGPTLNAVTLGSALSNTYGTAPTGVSFTASGSNLSTTITATPQSGYEVSTSSATTGFQSTGISSITSGSTVYVRNTATKSAGTTNGATAVILSSTGATSVNVTTSASGNTVSTASLTITGITANNKTYDGTTTATLSGTAAYSGLVNSESFTVTGSPSANFSDAAVGNGKTVTVTGYTAPSANYTVTQPTLTANITAAASPTIGISGTPLSAVSTTYGTASATPTTFSVSGAGLTNDIVINALSGFEYSTTLGSGYATSLTLTQSGGVVNATTIYVRLAATTAVGTYSGNISVTSTGATTQNVATVSSTVSAKALTITGLSATNKTYDGTTTVSVTGTAAYSGLVNSESFTVTGTPSYAFATASVGTAKSITVSGFTAPSSNYTVSQPSLTANITVASLSITASAQTKNFGTTSVTTGATSFTSSGLVNSETIGSVTLAYSGSPSGNLATATAGTYTITPSAATGGTFTASNYSITYNTGTLTINAVVASAPTITSITPGNAQLSVAFTAPSSTGGTTITNYKYSTDGGSTFTAVSPSQTTSPIVITGLTNNTTYSVQLLAVNSAGDGAASSSTSGTPSLYCIPSGSTSSSTYISSFSTTNGVANISNTSTYSTSGYGSFIAQSVTQYANTSVNFSVNLVGGTAGIGVWVDWNSDGDFLDANESVYNSNAYQSTGTTSSSFTVPSGQAAGSYRMRVIVDYNSTTPTSCVAASTSRGEAEDYTFTVLSAAVPSAPTITGITPTASGTLSVAFTAGAANGSAITNYKYSIDNGASFTAVSPSQTTSPIAITGLTPGTTYQIQIRAVNSVGDGTATASTSATAATTPNAPTITGITAGNAQLSVAFTAPSSNGFSTITDYQYSTNGGTSFTSAGTTTSPIVITGLTNNTTYQVQLRAVNAAGNGTATASTAGTPVAQVPSAPTGVTITAGDRQLSVAFTAGSNGGSTITDYKYSTDGGSTFTSAGTTTSPIVITGLTNGTTYQVQIRAVNAVGDGVATASVAGTPAIPPVIIYQHDFGTSTPATPYTGTPTVFNTNLNTSSWTCSGTFINAGGSSGQSLAVSSTGSGPFTLTFNVASGYQLSVSSYSYWRQTSSSASVSSITINGTTITSGALAAPTSGTAISTTNVANTISGLTGTITLVINLTGSGSFRLDDFTLNGNVTCITPSQPSTITGNTTVCESTSQTYSVTNTSGVAYTWVFPSGWSSTGTTNSVSATPSSTSGTISVTPYNSASGCTSVTGTARTLAVTANAAPTASNISAVGATTIAGNGAVVTVSSTTLATGSYTVTYSISGTNTVSSTTATMSFTAGNPGTGTFTTSALASTGSANVVNITAIAFNGGTGCSSTVSTSTAAFNTVSTVVTYSNVQYTSARNISRNATNVPIYRVQVDVTNAASTLSSLAFTTPADATNNSYVNSDITRFGAFLTTSATFSAGTQLGSFATSGKVQTNSGEVGINFTGLSTTLSVGTTYYIWLTADIANSATSGRTITVNAPTITVTGTTAGTLSATGVQTIVAGTPTNYYLKDNTAFSSSNFYTGTGGAGVSLTSNGLSLTSSDLSLIVDVTGASLSADLTLGNNSSITVGQSSSGSLNLASGFAVTGTVNVGAYGNLILTASSVPTLGTLATGSTVTYNQSGSQAVTSTTYDNLAFSGTGTRSLTAGVTVTGTLTVPNGITFNAGSNVVTGKVDIQSGATFITANTGGINGAVSNAAGSTFSTTANYEFNGTSSQVLGAALPSTVNNLTISNGNTALALGGSKTITGALALSNGTKLVIGGNTLTLNGTFSGTASSNLVGSATSNITIGGSGAVGTLRIDQTTNGTTNVLNNLVVNNSYTSGAAVTLGDSLRLVGTLTPSAGQLATGGYLTLLSTNEYNSAAIGAATGNTFTTNYITGNVTTQRYTRAQRGYRAMGHPFTTAQPLSILTDNIRITGLTDMPANPIAPQYGTSAGNPSAFLYNPSATAGTTATLTRLTSGLTAVWPKAQGLYLFVRGAGLQGSGGAGSSNYTGGNALTATILDGVGTVNQGDVTYDLVYGGTGKDNYNLVGNPYPSAINLKNVSNIPNGTIYVYNPIKNYGTVPDPYNVVGGFDSYTYTNGSSDVIVPAMGAFYVLATSNATITFHESDKVSASAPEKNVFGTSIQPKFSIKVTTQDGDVDDLKFGFSANATAASGDTYDAAKLSNSLFNLYSISSNKAKLTVDYRDLASLASTIPLGISTNVARNYTISLASIKDLPNTQLVLRDKFLKTETILSQVGDSYSFDITADTATKGENRFEIGLLGTTVLLVQIADITAQLQANKTVAVNWTSTTEINLAKYHVQRSKDGSNYTTIGTAAAKGASTYNYNDDLSTAGILPSTIYYRLEALDKDGSKTYSKVVSCQLSVASKSISIYPNPVQATLYARVTVTKAGAAQLRVVDAQGKVVATQKTQLAVGTTSVSIPAVQLAAGNYVLEIDSADGKQTQRFVKE